MKQKLTKFGLIFMTFFLLGSTIYITLLLNDTSPTATTTIKKTKAASVTYTKTLALNTKPLQPETLGGLEDEIQDPELTAIPTETLLSYNSTDQTGQPTEPSINQQTQLTQTQNEATTVPTGVTSLPQSGWMQSSIAIFAAASIFIFLSFLY